MTPTVSTSINGLDGHAGDDHADADDEHVDDEGDADDDDEEEDESAFERPKLEVKLEVNFQNARFRNSESLKRLLEDAETTL
ncbi:unnamed protein product [[Candida] boidinii]|nr:unnamed protein product [[Candida] boidinii]